MEKTNLKMAESQAHDIINKAKIAASSILSESTKAAQYQVNQHQNYLNDKLKQTKLKFNLTHLENESKRKALEGIDQIYHQYHANRKEAVTFLIEKITTFDIQINRNLRVDQYEDMTF